MIRTCTINEAIFEKLKVIANSKGLHVQKYVNLLLARYLEDKKNERI